MYIKKIIWAVVLLGLVGMAAFAYYVYSTVFTPNTAFNNPEAHVYIATGANFDQALAELEPLLKNQKSFVAVAQRKGYVDNVKSGHYIIRRGMNNNDIINAIRVGNVPITIKFNNQERIENLAGSIGSQLEADSLALLEAMTDPTFLQNAGFERNNALAMYIPNSYEVYWNESPEDFCLRMMKEYDAFWNPERLSKAKSIGLSPKQVVSLAAIVQKETSKVDERPRVAGLYVNRIKIGMPLQADPTIIYAMKLAENDFDMVIKRVLYRDLEIESPYNTYKNRGVPPGPITMPDISAIDGVLNHEKHDYLYMVANIQNFGYHKFAKSLAQHNRNRAEYVRWINEQGVRR